MTATLAHPEPHPVRELYTPPTREQLAAIERVLLHDNDPHRAACLLRAVSHRSSDCPSPQDGNGGEADLAAIRALRVPPHRDLAAALLRIARAIDAETEVLYHRQDAGHPDAAPALRAIAFQLLELGFTIAEQGGIDSRAIELAVAQAYHLPGYPPPRP